jgi:hypothetical protein
MNTANERKLGARATELGNSADATALPELISLTTSRSPLVRRLAASAIGKLAGIVPPASAVEAIHPLLQDDHPQVRQYSAKALGAFGIHAKNALQDLRDIYRNATEKDYVLRSVLTAGKRIRAAVDISERDTVHLCRRCNVKVDSDEYARSMRAFDRPFCDKCFDETYLTRRNFDTKVELNKTIAARDGTIVQSHGERITAEFLAEHGIEYRYDERIRIVQGMAIRPDFYLPEFDLYIEYWGMDTIDYKMGMLKKRKLYQQEGKRLVSVYYSDMPNLQAVLKRKLSKYIRL